MYIKVNMHFFLNYISDYAGKIKIKETLISGSVRQVVSQIPQVSRNFYHFIIAHDF